MPLIWSSWSIEERPPCWSRKSMMSCAVTGPMPSISSSCSTVAVPSETGPSPPAAAAGDDHLLAVAEAGGEVDRVLGGAAVEAAGALDGVGDAGADREAVDAGLGDGAGDVDDDVAGGIAARLEALGIEAEGAGAGAGRGGGGRGADPAGADQEDGDGDRCVDEQLGAAQLGHAARVRRGGARVARRVLRAASGSRTS